jgi:hypothetical protein
LTKKKGTKKKNSLISRTLKKIASLTALGKKRNCILEKKKIFTEEILHFILCKRGGHKTPNDVMGCKRNLPSSTQGKKQVLSPNTEGGPSKK